jgi:small-conductance mechanosensitive channel
MALTTTTVRTFDGRQVLIPNSTMHSSVVVVQTGYESVRTSVHVDLDERVDVQEATRVALAAMVTSPEVAPAPPPEALLVAVGTGTLRMELRFWSGARQLETLEAQDAVIRAVIDAFHSNGVTTGTQTHVVEAAPSLERALESVRVLPDSLAMSGDDAAGSGQGARRPTQSSDSE